MESKVRMKCIIIISILLIILISIILYNVVYLPSVEEDKQLNEEENNIPVKEIKHLSIEGKTLEICNEDVDCGLGERTYYTISTDLTDEMFVNAINNINTKINNAYLTSLNSTNMTTSECSNVSNLYMRSIMTQSMLTLYGSDELINITLVTATSNLCLSTNDEEIYLLYYDITNKKILTEDEIKTKYSVTNDEIITAINNDINQRNIDENLNYSTNVLDYHIYIDSEGILSVYYKQYDDNIYYSVPLDVYV